jgi:hypothetical protein
MKIRTDFVTNSSSESTAEIVIDNPLLLEILQKYKDIGTFGDEKLFFGIGEYHTKYNNSVGSEFESKIKTPAFYYHEDLCAEGWTRVGGCPRKLTKVLEEIINLIGGCDEGQFDKEKLNQMEKELRKNKIEIGKNYAKVSWSYEDLTDNPEGDEIRRWFYSYSPVDGEKYVETEAAVILGWNNDTDEG